MCKNLEPGLTWLSKVTIGNNVNTGKFIKMPTSAALLHPCLVDSALCVVAVVFLFIYLV